MTAVLRDLRPDLDRPPGDERVKDERVIVRAVRPDDRSRFRLDTDLAELGGVLERREYPDELETRTGVDLALDPVIEPQTEAVPPKPLGEDDVGNRSIHADILVEGIDPLQRCLGRGQAPIFHEFGAMPGRPFENEPEGARRQFAAGHFKGGDRDHHLEPLVPSMEVRRRMVVVVHRDDDPEKPSDLGHKAFYADEIVKFTRDQILQQTGVSALAQANLIPSAVLALLG